MYAKVSYREDDEIIDIALSPLALSHIVTFWIDLLQDQVFVQATN
jgi:hypothetical protein